MIEKYKMLTCSVLFNILAEIGFKSDIGNSDTMFITMFPIGIIHLDFSFAKKLSVCYTVLFLQSDGVNLTFQAKIF